MYIDVCTMVCLMMGYHRYIYIYILVPSMCCVMRYHDVLSPLRPWRVQPYSWVPKRVLSSAVHVPVKGRFYGWCFAYHKYVVYHHDFVIFASYNSYMYRVWFMAIWCHQPWGIFGPTCVCWNMLRAAKQQLLDLQVPQSCVFAMCVKSTALEAHAAVACLNVTCSLSTKCHQIAHHKASMNHLAFFVVSKGKKNPNEQTLGGLTRWRNG